jgi:ankyrin repeat protein
MDHEVQGQERVSAIDVNAIVTQVNLTELLSTTCTSHLLTPAASSLYPQLLIQHGADINAADKDGRTPLMTAIVRGHVSVAVALLQANASVAVADMHGINALMCAAADPFPPSS